MKLLSEKFCFLCMLTGCSFCGFAQRIDYNYSFRELQKKSYFRFHFDNDYFTKTDYYYSQGITFEYVHPSLQKILPAKLLLKPSASRLQYGLAFNIFGYTPTSIRSDDILYGDRPYASCMSITMFSVAGHNIKQQRITSSISVGVIGPAAQGMEIQSGIHRWLKNVMPKGWQHQVKNDVILNYNVAYEKKLLGIKDWFILNKTGELRLGTLNDKLSAGFNFMAGHFNNPYQFVGRKKKTTWYLYAQSRLQLIGYDASLQGGLFDRHSEYTISSAQLSRMVYQADAGIIVNFNKIFFSYTQSFLSKEFNSGLFHRWGGISAGLSL